MQLSASQYFARPYRGATGFGLMSRAPQTFKQRDATRLVRAVMAAGLPVRAIEADNKSGTPSSRAKTPPLPDPHSSRMIWIANWPSSRIPMVKFDLKGIKKVRSKGHIYYYAWRGGPPLRGEPGSPEFLASYNEAIENRRASRRGAIPLAGDVPQGER